MRRLTSLVMITTLLSAPAAPARPVTHGAVEAPPGATHSPTSVSVDNYILLFDTRAYREKVLPAYKAFFDKDDPAPLIRLLREVIGRLDGAGGAPSGPRLEPREVYEEAIGILDGSVYYDTRGSRNPGGRRKTTRKSKRAFVRGSLGYDLLVALCVPRGKGFSGEQGLTTSDLSRYLGARSVRVEQLIMGQRQLRGGVLEVGGGETPLELFSDEDVREFTAELAGVTPPESPSLRAEYDNLLAMARAALEDPDLTLVHMLA